MRLALVTLVWCILCAATPRTAWAWQSEQLIDDLKSRLAEQDAGLIKAWDRRSKLLRSSTLYFDSYSNGLHIGKVYTSSYYTVVLGPDCVICLSERGGFKLQKSGDAAVYRVEKAATVKDIRNKTAGFRHFLETAGYDMFGVVPHLSNSSISQIGLDIDYFKEQQLVNLTVTRDNDTTIVDHVSKTTDLDNLNCNIYSNAVAQSSGERLIYKHSMSIKYGPINTKATSTRQDSYTYYSPGTLYPISLLKDRTRTEMVAGNPSINTNNEYRNYRILEFPADQLRLSYYGLPNELVEDDTSNLAPLWVSVGVAGGVFAILLVRRHRRS